MRLFVALELPDEVKDQLVALKTDLPDAVWVKRPALHLTLRFLGDRIDPIRLTPIQLALASIRAESFSLALRGTGRFPSGARRPARVLWVGLTESPPLLTLHAAVEQALASADFPPEDRPFSPHITLARLKGDQTAPQIERFLDRQRGFHSDAFTVSSFHLMSSVLTPEGPNYRHEGTFDLN
jgi:2'-5' RNA ligase